MRKGRIIFSLFLSFCMLNGKSLVRLDELSGIGGKFIVLKDLIYTFDNKDFSIKVFSSQGKLKKTKSIKGEGPGEVSTLGSWIALNGEKILIIEGIKKKWIEYDKDLNFLREGGLEKPFSVVKRMGKVLVSGVTDVEEGKHCRKIYLLSEDLKVKKEIYREYGKALSFKMDSNEFHFTLDITDKLIAFGCGSSNKVKIIDIHGNLKKEIKVKVKPTKYDEHTLQSIERLLPLEAKKLVGFGTYPFIFQVLFVSNRELMIITGEIMSYDQAKSYIYDLKTQRLRNIIIPVGIYWYDRNVLIILSEDEEGCFLQRLGIK